VNAPAKPPVAFKPLSVLKAIYSRSHNLPTNHRTVLAAMLPFMDNKSGKTHVSQATLAAVTKLSPRAVGSVIGDLRSGWTTRKLTRVDLLLPFRFHCAPKVPEPGEPKREGRPPLEYTIELVAPVAGNSAKENPAPVAEIPAEFPEPVAEKSAGGFSATAAGVFGNGAHEFSAPVAEDLREASDLDLKRHVATDAPPPLQLHPVDGSATKKPKRQPKRATSPDDVDRVFRCWCEDLAPLKYKRVLELTKERQRAIEKALTTHSVGDLELAIRGVRKDPFLCGENPAGAKHVELESIFKTGARIDKHIATASQPESASKNQRRNGTTLKQTAPTAGRSWTPAEGTPE